MFLLADVRLAACRYHWFWSFQFQSANVCIASAPQCQKLKVQLTAHTHIRVPLAQGHMALVTWCRLHIMWYLQMHK